MIRNLELLKNVFYDILASGEDGDQPDVSAVQKMGVGITKSMQKEGNIVILQSQNVVQKKVTMFAVSGLRRLDSLIHDAHMIEMKAIDKVVSLPMPEETKEEAPDLRDVCKHLLGQGIGYSDFKKLMQKLYLETAMMYSGSMSEAAGKLQVNASNLRKILERHGVPIKLGGEKDASTKTDDR